MAEVTSLIRKVVIREGGVEFQKGKEIGMCKYRGKYNRLSYFSWVS